MVTFVESFIGFSCDESLTRSSFFLSDETEMRFGGLVSTSNLVKEDKITVQSDSDLLWTITIKKP